MKIYPFGNDMLEHVPPWNKVLQNKWMNKLNAEKFTFCEDLSFFVYFYFWWKFLIDAIYLIRDFLLNYIF